MRLLVPTILITLLMAALPADAAPPEIDFVLTFRDDGTWHYDGPTGMLTARSEETGTRYTWDLLTPDGPAYGEVRYTLATFHLDEAKQLRPSLDLGTDRFPLFHYFPRPAVWETDGPAQVYHIHFEEETAVLRLQVPQTTEGRFILERDITPPGYTLGEPERITPHSFYQETQTDELALAEIQVRKEGSGDDWVRHPTPALHVLQKFPIQGLDPDTRYEVQARFTDWSNNSATSERYLVTTPPHLTGAPPRFEVIEPIRDAILPSGTDPVVRVRILDGDTPVDPATIRLFVDLEERRGAFVFEDGVLTYTYPQPPADGPHVVSVEAKTLDGAEGHIKWGFHVGEPVTARSPAPGILVIALFGLVASQLRRHAQA